MFNSNNNNLNLQGKSKDALLLLDLVSKFS